MSEDRNIEPSSQRRRQLIRERGIPKSGELTTALALLLAATWFRSCLGEWDPTSWCDWLVDWQRGISMTRIDAGQDVGCLLRRFGIYGGGLLAAAWLLCLGCVSMQGGWTWRSAIGRLGGDGNGPSAGPAWWTTLLAVAKLLMIPLLLGYCLYRRGNWQSNLAIDDVQIIRSAVDWLLSSTQFIATGWLLLGVTDYVFRIGVFRRSLRWTATEWREELKRLEGRAPVRRLQR